MVARGPAWVAAEIRGAGLDTGINPRDAWLRWVQRSRAAYRSRGTSEGIEGICASKETHGLFGSITAD
jgi:hypothetical protein